MHLIDFGLALNTNSFKNRKLVFPLGFAAPELILNQLHIVDPSTDIYALGILIWRLYVGELPLKHANPSIFTNLQLTHPLPSHTKIRKELFTILSKMCVKYNFKMPPNIMPKEEVLKCLNLAQKERYQGLGQVLEDLEKIRIKKTWF